MRILREETLTSRIIEYYSGWKCGWRIGRQRKYWIGWITVISLWWFCYPTLDKFVDHFNWKQSR